MTKLIKHFVCVINWPMTLFGVKTIPVLIFIINVYVYSKVLISKLDDRHIIALQVATS